jgi:hypothetical protein
MVNNMSENKDRTMSRGSRWGYWLFVLVLGPLAADGIFVMVGGTIDTYSRPPWIRVPVLGAVIGLLTTLAWTLFEPPSRSAIRALAAATLGALLSVAWGVALFIAVLAIACHGKENLPRMRPRATPSPARTAAWRAR